MKTRIAWSMGIGVAAAALVAACGGAAGETSPSGGGNGDGRGGDTGGDGGAGGHGTTSSSSSGQGTGGDAANVTATIAIDTAHATPVSSGFSGFNWGVTSIPNPTTFDAEVASLLPGWIRYPGGDCSQAFDWKTGLMPQAMLDEWSSDAKHQAELTNSSMNLVAAGGEPITTFSSFATGAGAEGLIVCINGFTDTAERIGELAAYTRAQSIPVLAWELSNEPYDYPSFFANGLAYANAMQPYAAAILAEDPTAVISLFAVGKDPAWLASVQQYPHPYWTAHTLHDYHSPPQSATTLEARMEYYDDYLANGLAAEFTSVIGPIGLPVLVTEFDAGNPDNDPYGGCMYEGVYNAEYTLRLSREPLVRHVGMHALSGTVTGIEAHGGYLNAEILGVGVANLALAHATAADRTTVSGGATVPTAKSTVPALFAQAYEGDDHRRHLVVTNKGASTEVVAASVDGAQLTSKLSLSWVSAADPSTKNSSNAPNAVAVQTATVTGDAITVPPYSVVHVAWAH